MICFGYLQIRKGRVILGKPLEPHLTPHKYEDDDNNQDREERETSSTRKKMVQAAARFFTCYKQRLIL